MLTWSCSGVIFYFTWQDTTFILFTFPTSGRSTRRTRTRTSWCFFCTFCFQLYRFFFSSFLYHLTWRQLFRNIVLKCLTVRHLSTQNRANYCCLNRSQTASAALKVAHVPQMQTPCLMEPFSNSADLLLFFLFFRWQCLSGELQQLSSLSQLVLFRIYFHFSWYFW